jgi:hypothetical protein
MLCLACAPLLAGCGGSSPKRDPVQEARVISEANAFCRQLSTTPQVSRGSEQRTRAIQARSAALERVISRTAAYLPAGKDLNEAHAARRALYAADARRLQAGRPLPTDVETRFRRIQLRIYDDELALGFTCAGKVAREAHETAHVLATSAP